jgi:hypothetical protein
MKLQMRRTNYNRRTAALCSFVLFLQAIGGNTPLARADGPGSSTEWASDATLQALTRIAGSGMIRSDAYSDLEELSDDIGARLTGSPQAAKAVEWALAKMRTRGLVNVHSETWHLARRWTRGVATAEIVEPIRRSLSVDSMGWVGSTREGGVDADLVSVDLGETKRTQIKTRQHGRTRFCWSCLRPLLATPSRSAPLRLLNS